MKWQATGTLGALVLILTASSGAFGQTMAPSPNQSASQATQLQELTKKIDEQNAKIDMLSQEILKLQLEVTNRRPGVMIGEGAPTGTTSTTTSTSSATAEASAKTGNDNSHIVARGETLTSIAKMYGVSVVDLQKYNHIDNPLKLQAGQTLLIPPSPIPSPSSSGQ